MGKTSQASIDAKIKGLKTGQSLLVSAIKTSNPNKIQIEVAEKIASFTGSANALLALTNKSDDRFGSGARRAWHTGEMTDLAELLGINFGDDAEWEMIDGKERLLLGVVNPIIADHVLRVQVQETTTPDEYQEENMESTAKRAGADGDIITSGGVPVYSNTVVVPCLPGTSPEHVILKMDAVESKVAVESGSEDDLGL